MTTDGARNLIDSHDPISMTMLLDAAQRSGATDLPSEAILSAGRVWPAGQEWIAEVGAPPDTHALDELYPDQDQAQAALRDMIESERDRVVHRLRAAGGILAELADTRDRWERPRLHVWRSPTQRDPHIHSPALSHRDSSPTHQ